ncbi:FIG00773679: hypothetical protein [Leuconostoc inhae]|uniref:Uncharacterized protein n=2 Tax=Leuconostoc TaxID=1243 RepID=A0AAN2UHB8_9LACO|nr:MULTISPECIES: hypothetical protein [Leuconostoc]MBM7435707.1 hypothetical protein [Leuconostoc rapi]MBZ5959100.1 hypothetical protein [Leuconostoc gasicomitatum]MBZ5981472.1 hypothetical protein [Leuconostoc gasicomitatum]MBZ5982291.1 hypothetical protein [Leuconostoc gasicomitatum]MBZ5987676.1 hypothetical protein [Leuconostoc gasicomitatum]
MAKKSMNQQIQEKQARVVALDLQMKAIQEEKRQIKKEMIALNDAQIAELGRSLLEKMNLSPNDIDQAFSELNHLPIIKEDGGQNHDDQ